jgi:GNAT superfamily N-acetyltransferase
MLEENKHMAQFQVEVLPEHRRRGLGTELLRRAVEVAERHGRRLLMAYTHSTVPDGEAFLRRIGGQAALAQHVNQLELAGVDRALLRQWQERAKERASGFELVLWEGPPYPEEELVTVTAMMEAANLIPHGDLDVEDFHLTPDQVRELDKVHAQQGYQRWTMVVHDPANDRVAGFTEVGWRPGKPDLIEQFGTAVFTEYQNRGVGRWLKAAMLEKILRDRPEATRVQTGNADLNAPMLSINNQLGFKPYVATINWQVEVAAAQAYLEAKHATEVMT